MQNYWLILLSTIFAICHVFGGGLQAQNSLKDFLLNLESQQVKEFNIENVILKEADKIKEEYTYNKDGFLIEKKYTLFGKNKFFYNKKNKPTRSEKFSKAGKLRHFTVYEYPSDTIEKETSYRPDSSIRHTEWRLLDEKGLCIQQKFSSETLNSWEVISVYNEEGQLLNQKKFDQNKVLQKETIFDTKDTTKRVAYTEFGYKDSVKYIAKSYLEEYDSLGLMKTINCEGDKCRNCLQEFFYDQEGNEIAYKAYNENLEVEKHYEKQYDSDNKILNIVKYNVDGDLSDKIIFEYNEEDLPKSMKKLRYFYIYDKEEDNLKVEERLVKYQQLFYDFFSSKKRKKKGKKQAQK